MKLYQELLMDHYQHPRNKGSLENSDFSTVEHNPSCGDSVAFQGQIKNNRLTAVAFTGKGCVISQATASLLSEWAKNKSLEEITKLNPDDIQAMIGMQLGPMRLRCALLPLQALQQGVIEYENKKK